jgi:hypothetical protein
VQKHAKKDTKEQKERAKAVTEIAKKRMKQGTVCNSINPMHIR